MEKILVSTDPTLIAIEIQKLFEKLYHKKEGDLISKHQELEKAKSLCGHESPLICLSACNAVLRLVKTKRIDLPTAYSWLSSCIFTAKNMCGLIQLTTDLFILDASSCGGVTKLQFLKHTQEHPFIEIIQCSSKHCHPILACIQNICHDSDKIIVASSVNFLSPVFRFILSGNSTLPLACRTAVWDILVHLKELQLITDCLAQFIFSDVESGFEYLHVASKLLENTDDSDIKFVSSVVPSIAAAVQFLIESGVCPDRALDFLFVAVSKAPSVSSLVVMILAETVLSCSSRHLFPILNTCLKIMKTSRVSTISELMVISSFLRWLIQPTFLQPEVLDAMSALIDLTLSRKDSFWPPLDFLNNYYLLMISAPHRSVQKAAYLHRLYSNICSKDECLNTWLKSENSNFEDFKLFLSGLLLSAQPEEQKRSVIQKLSINGAEQHLTTFVFQLAREKDPKTQLKLLESLHLCITKTNQENKLIVLQILKGLSSSDDPTLQGQAIYLQFLFWKVEHRYFPFLHTALLADNEPSYEMDMVKAKVVNEICKISPEIYGKNVARPISNILNRSQFSQPCVLALNSIFCLCKAGEIDIESTWNALRPKFTNEKRPEIIKGICEILSLVPSLISYLDEAKQEFYTEVVKTLWSFVTQNSNQEIVGAALKAFSKFRLDHLSLDTFPDVYKESSEKAIRTALANSVAEFVYIPGKCWLKVLESLPVSCHNETVELFTKWLSDEIASFHSGIYSKVLEEPTAYSFLHERSLCRSFVEHIRKYSTVSPLTENLQHSIYLCLRILAGPLPKPLPPLKWTFLQNYMSGEWTALKTFGTKLAIKQAMHKSSSASNILEAKLSTLAVKEETEQEILTVFESVSGVFRSIHSSTIQDFVNRSFEFASEKISQFNDANFYTAIVISLKNFLSENHMESRDQFLSKMLQDQWTIFNSIPACSSCLIDCISVLSDEHINEIFPPPVDENPKFDEAQSYMKLVCSVASIRKTSESIDRLINCVRICSSCHEKIQDKDVSLLQSNLQNQLLPIFAHYLPHASVMFFVKGLMGLIENHEDEDLDFLSALLIRVIIVSVGLSHCSKNDFSALPLHALPLAVTYFITEEESIDFKHFFSKLSKVKAHELKVSFSLLFKQSLIALNSFHLHTLS